MANGHSDRLIPVNLQPGRLDEFLGGVDEAHDKLTKGALMSIGVALAPMAWSSFRKYMKDH